MQCKIKARPYTLIRKQNVLNDEKCTNVRTHARLPKQLLFVQPYEHTSLKFCENLESIILLTVRHQNNKIVGLFMDQMTFLCPMARLWLIFFLLFFFIYKYIYK